MSFYCSHNSPNMLKIPSTTCFACDKKWHNQNKLYFGLSHSANEFLNASTNIDLFGEVVEIIVVGAKLFYSKFVGWSMPVTYELLVWVRFVNSLNVVDSICEF